MTPLGIDDWVTLHPYLASVAGLHTAMDAAIAAAVPPLPSTAVLDAYREDFREGVPLLHSAASGIDFLAAAPGLLSVVGSLRESAVAGAADELHRWLQDDGTAAIPWVMGADVEQPPQPGLLRCVGWRTLATALAPVLADFGAWRDEQRWLRRYCPGCGSPPSMSQLIGVDPGRERFLHCGCCRSTWRFPRTTCPFCETDTHRRAALTIDGEPRLRVDYCEACRGYLKTYAGHGDEAVLLADWTTLHLDMAALSRGWSRVAASLYDVVPPDDAPPLFSGGSGHPEVVRA